MYKVIAEKWDENIKGDNIIIENNICTRIDDAIGENSAFGEIIIDNSGCYKWSFRVNKINLTAHVQSKYWAIWIGIIKDADCESVKNTYLTNNYSGYAWVPIRSNPALISRLSLGSLYGKQVHEGDIIEMIFSFDELKLKYIVNGNDYGYAVFDNKIRKEKYRMGVSLYNKGNEIELLDFCIVSE